MPCFPDACATYHVNNMIIDEAIYKSNMSCQYLLTCFLRSSSEKNTVLQYQVLKKCVLYDVVCPPETYMMDRIESTQGRKKKKVREEKKRLIA